MRSLDLLSPLSLFHGICESLPTLSGCVHTFNRPGLTFASLFIRTPHHCVQLQRLHAMWKTESPDISTQTWVMYISLHFARGTTPHPCLMVHLRWAQKLRAVLLNNALRSPQHSNVCKRGSAMWSQSPFSWRSSTRLPLNTPSVTRLLYLWSAALQRLSQVSLLPRSWTHNREKALAGRFSRH